MLNFFSEYWKHHAVSLESRCGKWGTNKVNRELSSSSPQQLGLGGCELLAQQSAAIRRATGQFTFFLCWKQGFFFLLLFCVHLLPPKKRKFSFFFSQQDNYFGASGSKMVKQMTKWTFIQSALLPVLPSLVEVFFLHHWATVP